MSDKLRTLIVGGTGFIGSHLVRLLCEDDQREVIVAGRRTVRPTNLDTRADYVPVDVADDRTLLPLLTGVSDLVDLAYGTVPKTSFDDPIHDVLTNLPATVNLLKRASEFPLRRFLLISSGGTVYGNTDKLPIDESCPRNPVSPYGITKVAAENYARMFLQLSRLPVVIARPGNPYGPEQFGQLAQGFIGSAMHAVLNRSRVTVFGDRGTIRDYIHIDDLCRGLIAALEYGEAGDIFNIGTGIGQDNLSILELLSDIVSHDGYTLDIEFKPARPFDVAANVLNSSRLTSASGWHPQVSLESGLRATWDFVKGNLIKQ